MCCKSELCATENVFLLSEKVSYFFLCGSVCPQACFELGTGSPEMTLRIPLGTECGTVQQVSPIIEYSVRSRPD